jgi:hypothetical protein
LLRDLKRRHHLDINAAFFLRLELGEQGKDLRRQARRRFSASTRTKRLQLSLISSPNRPTNASAWAVGGQSRVGQQGRYGLIAYHDSDQLQIGLPLL